jgi:DNA-directed RNA polymerase subunit E'/Rpb7
MERRNKGRKFNNKPRDDGSKKSLYTLSRITKKVVIPMKCVGATLVKTFEDVISAQIGGKCIVEGYVKPNTIRAVTYSSGVIKGDNIEFEVVFNCEIFYPVAGMNLNCIAKEITKAGIRAESSDEDPSPFVLFVAKDHFFNDEYFNSIKPDDRFIANVIGIRFELDDEKISIIASPVQPNRDNFRRPLNIEEKNDEVVERIHDEPVPEHRIAIIVPFRDSDDKNTRTEQLENFVVFMNNYLSNAEYKIFVIEQSNDGRKFNRGALLNIGFSLAEKEGYEIFIFHDVDLLPSNELKEYYIELPTNPVHIASVWDRYNQNPKYFGGIVAFNKQAFNRINGFPNNFWGWGGEDDELYKRVVKFYSIKKANKGTVEDLEKLNIDDKLKTLRDNDSKFMQKIEALAEHDSTWQKNGLNSLEYDEIDNESCGINCSKTTVDLSKIGDFVPRAEEKPIVIKRKKGQK